MKVNYTINSNSKVNLNELRNHLSRKFDIYNIQPNKDTIIITTRKLEEDKLILLNKEVLNFSLTNELKLEQLEKKINKFEKELTLLKNEIIRMKNGESAM